MSNYENWKKEYISKDASRKYLSDKQIREVYMAETSSKNLNSSSQNYSTSNNNAMSNEQDYRLNQLEGKLDDIHATLKAIRWILAGGFLFIMMVISGLIKPGIFS